MKTQRFSEIDSPVLTFAVSIGAAMAIMPLMVGPLLVGEYQRTLGFSQPEAGSLLSAEMWGLTLGALLLLRLVHSNWQRLLWMAFICMVLGNAMAGLGSSYAALIIARGIVGLGAGIVMTLTMQVISMTRSPDTVYGIWSVGQILMGAVWLLIIPKLIAVVGLPGIFFAWAACALLITLTISHYPRGRQFVTNTPTEKRVGSKAILGWLCLLGMVIYYAGQAGVWSFVEAVGIDKAIPLEAVQLSLMISLIAAIAGSAVAIMIGNTYGRALPLSVSLCLSALGLASLHYTSTDSAFLLAVCLFNFAWYLFLPYISAVVAAIDEAGTFLTLLSVAFPASLAAGPAIAALLLAHSGNLLAVLLFGFFSVPIGLALMLPAARDSAKPQSTVNPL